MRVVRILTTLIRFHITHHYNAITHYNTAKYTSTSITSKFTYTLFVNTCTIINKSNIKHELVYNYHFSNNNSPSSYIL